MKLKTYPTYINSGVEWIGEIPSNWSTNRFKNVFEFSKDKSYEKNPVILSLTQKGIKKRDISTNEGQLAASYDGYHKVRKKDIVMNPMDLISGFVDSSNIEGIISPAYYILKVKIGVDPEYFKYFLQKHYYEEIFFPFAEGVSTEHRWTLKKEDLMNFSLILPPIKEQHQISKYLDKKTSEIEFTIEKDTQLIELLKEKRTALINHVVIKGLSPKAKMKDSGVEWIGKIPEDWAMIKVKHLAGNCSNSVQTGPFGAQLHAEDYVDTGIPFILIRNVNHGRINMQNIPFVSEDDAIRLSMYRLNVGDIVFSRVGSLGRAALVTENEEGWLISGQMLRLRLHDKRINAAYLVYVFQSYLSSEYVSLESVGSTRESLNTEILSNLPFPLPPKEEQQDIIEYLANEISKIDLIIQKVEKNIAYLEEYKKSLIHHVVTGKVDVGEVTV